MRGVGWDARARVGVPGRGALSGAHEVKQRLEGQGAAGVGEPREGGLLLRDEGCADLLGAVGVVAEVSHRATRVAGGRDSRRAVVVGFVAALLVDLVRPPQDVVHIAGRVLKVDLRPTMSTAAITLVAVSASVGAESARLIASGAVWTRVRGAEVQRAREQAVIHKRT